ncbi:MAG: glycosyltransferase, partial [Pirellulaceae bacterium]
VFSDLDVDHVQAPYHDNRGQLITRQTIAYVDILRNCGFADSSLLESRVNQWLELFDLHQPSLVICDHSPTTLLAARLTDVRTVMMGSGFSCPPICEPMVSLHPQLDIPRAELIAREQVVLDVVNSVLIARDRPPLESLAQLYGDVDATFLTTIEELDHFGPRPHVRYWGAWSRGGGERPVWPASDKKRVVAYLTHTPGLDMLLDRLSREDFQCLIFGTWVTAELQQEFSDTGVFLLRNMIDFQKLGGQCDLALLNATHGATFVMLRQGIPVVQLPTHVEQRLIARCTTEIGAGLQAGTRDPDSVIESMHQVLANGSYREAALQVARRYQDCNLEGQFGEMMDALQELLRPTAR